MQLIQQCTSKTEGVLPHCWHQLWCIWSGASQHPGRSWTTSHWRQAAAWCMVVPDFPDGQVSRAGHHTDSQARYCYICCVSTCSVQPQTTEHHQPQTLSPSWHSVQWCWQVAGLPSPNCTWQAQISTGSGQEDQSTSCYTTQPNKTALNTEKPSATLDQ